MSRWTSRAWLTWIAASTVTGACVLGLPPVLGPDLLWGVNSVVQAVVLRRLIRYAALWPILTTLILVLYDLVAFYTFGVWSHLISGNLLVMSIATWAVVGVAQGLLLRASTRQALFWVMASVTAGAAYGAVSSIMYGIAPLVFQQVLFGIIGGAIAGGSYGAITGAAMRWLWRYS